MSSKRLGLEEAAVDYLQGLGASSKQRHSRLWLARFFEFCGPRGVSEVAQIDFELLNAYRQHLFWKPGPKGVLYSQNSLFQAQQMVRLFVRWLHSRELLLVDPTQGWILRRPQARARQVPSVENVARLLAAPSAQHRTGLRSRAVLELLYGTGIRLAECEALNLDSVDLETSRLHVRGKGAKDRALPIGASLRLSLSRYLEVRSSFKPGPEEAAFFLSVTGRRLEKQNLRAAIWRACELAGLPRFGPHMLRHAFAVHLMEQGADLAYIQVLLGHENVSTTAIYTEVRSVELAAEYRRTHPRARRDSSQS